MKSTLTEKKASVVEGEVTLTSEEFLAYWNPAHEAAIGEVVIPGFRKGTAPRELATKHINPDAVFEEAVNRAVRATLSGLCEDNDWRIISGPEVEIKEASPAEKKSGGSFRYHAKFVIFPRIELGNYKKIAEEVRAQKKEAIVSDEEVAQSLEWLRGSRAKIVAVNREAKKGDVIEADIESFVGADPVPGGKLLHDRFLLGESRFIPGFDDALVQKQTGARVEFTLTAPADYWEASLRGKEVRFSVMVRGVFERELPALDGAFAESLGGSFKTVEDLKKSIREGMSEEKNARERDRLRALMLEEVGKKTKMDIPDIMVERTLQGLIDETARLTNQGSADAEKLRAALKEKAIARVRGYLVIHAIAEKENLEPTEDEIKDEATKSGVDPKTAYDYSYGIVRNRKVFEFLEKN